MKRMFETRSHSWREAGLARQLNRARLRRARIQVLLFSPLLGGILFVYANREALIGADTPVRAATVIALLMLGWRIARDLGRLLGPDALPPPGPGHRRNRRASWSAWSGSSWSRWPRCGSPACARRRSPSVARSPRSSSASPPSRRSATCSPGSCCSARARSGWATACGSRARASTIEGVVSSLGLLYTSLDNGEDTIMVPNSVVLSVAVIPLREPDGVDMRARLRPGVTPSEIEALLREHVQTPLRGRPEIALEELDGDEVVVRIAATPRNPQDGSHLASEVLAVVSSRERAGGAALALVALPRLELLAEPVAAQPASHRGRHARGDPGERGHDPHAERRDVDLDRLRSIAFTTRLGDLLGRAGAHVRTGAWCPTRRTSRRRG